MDLRTTVKANNLIKIGFVGLFLKGALTDLFQVLCLLVFGKVVSFFSTFISIFCISLLAIGVIAVFCKKLLFVVLSTLFFVLIWFVSGLQHPETIEIIKESYFDFFSSSLPYLWFFYYFFDSKANYVDSHFSFIYKLSLNRLIISLITQSIMFVFPKTDLYGDYMIAGYSLLVPSVFVFAYCFSSRERRRYPKILLCISLFYIILLGCRGALVCFLSFWVLAMITKTEEDTHHSVIKKIGIIILLLISGLIIILLARFAVFLGLNSKTILRLAGGDFYSDSMRLEIYRLSIESIRNNLLGTGILSDRLLFPVGWNVPYCHNIILELGIDFGILGLVFFVVFVFLCFFVTKETNEASTLLICACFCASVVRLLVSSSMWVDHILYALLGLLLSNIHVSSKKKRRISISYNQSLLSGLMIGK